MQKLRLLVVLLLSVVSFSLPVTAQEKGDSLIYDENAAIVGREYLFEAKSASAENKAPQVQTAQLDDNQNKIFVSDSSCIFIAENAEIYGKQFLLHGEQKNPSKAIKKASPLKKETAEVRVAENESFQQEAIGLFPEFPSETGSFSFLQGGDELATVSPQHNLGGSHLWVKAYRGKIYVDINDLCLLYSSPEQKQKLSAAATQCGTLTSFGAQSPPRKG